VSIGKVEMAMLLAAVGPMILERNEISEGNERKKWHNGTMGNLPSKPK